MIAAFFVYCYGQATFFHSQLIYPTNIKNLSWARWQPEHRNYEKSHSLCPQHSPVALPTLQADKLQDSRSTLVVRTDWDGLMCPWKS